MRLIAALSIAALMTACAGEEETAAPSPAAEPAREAAAPADAAAEPGPEVAERAALEAMRAQFARVEMNPDISFLTDEEREVVNLLNRVGELMDEIYLRQISEDNPQLRTQIAAGDHPHKALLLDLFDLHFGVWDSLDENRPFYGSTPLPPGAGFYPADMTREEFEAWIAAHPADEAAFRSPYTVIRRDGDGLVAIPYSEHYREWLAPAAELMREAAALTGNESLRRFLTLRADSFETNDYFESEIAWMDLEGTPIEAAIGPYEVYTDQLFGLKTAFEAFITVMNPQESEALAKYKDWLRDMEANLPVEEGYKNFDRGFESPIVVSYQVHGGGDNRPGVQTIAFNLPNDERVREAKGAKKVILNNVLGAKFERILEPMGDHVLVAEQAGLLDKKYMEMGTLFHELSHSMGPGSITVDGRETTVNAELQELYTPMEEGKADVMGVWNMLYMMERGELPAAEKESMLATYFAGLFRSMRFGTVSAHGRGAAFQYNFIRAAGAAEWDAAAERYRLDFAKLEAAVRDLTRDVVVLQGDGDYARVETFLTQRTPLDDEARAVIASPEDLPVDIQPVYESRL